MTEMSPERPVQGVLIQAYEYVRTTSEPGGIFNTNLPRYLESGMTPEAMLQDVEVEHGVRLSQVARTALGGWAEEETKRYNDQQAQRGEL